MKLREDSWGRRQQGWSVPSETNISDGERRMFDISSVSTSGVGDWVAEIETVIGIATPRWRSELSKDRSLRSCERSAACIRSLAKLTLETFSVAEQANRSYYYRQDLSRSGKLPVLSLLTGPKSAFSPRKSDSLHRFAWNLARPKDTWVACLREISRQSVHGGVTAARQIWKFPLSVKSGPTGTKPLTDFYKS